ncbi:hypothetical protein CDAR_280831 [Caerostris darwini]|uniref:Uncharacterized protein n=1 Tax=Caerostris darwini TaxID=1538125 RepID=A0AAV4VUW7_9ARAC|nr:hypothetical protein CDAR_280831 [Caerostris darwini]
MGGNTLYVFPITGNSCIQPKENFVKTVLKGNILSSQCPRNQKWDDGLECWPMSCQKRHFCALLRSEFPQTARTHIDFPFVGRGKEEMHIYVRIFFPSILKSRNTFFHKSKCEN